MEEDIPNYPNCDFWFCASHFHFPSRFRCIPPESTALYSHPVPFDFLTIAYYNYAV